MLFLKLRFNLSKWQGTQRSWQNYFTFQNTLHQLEQSREEGTSDGSRGGKSKADSFWGTRGQVRKYFEQRASRIIFLKYMDK